MIKSSVDSFQYTGETLGLKKAAVVCCSLATLILESFGWVLMYRMGYIALSRTE